MRHDPTLVRWKVPRLREKHFLASQPAWKRLWLRYGHGSLEGLAPAAVLVGLGGVQPLVDDPFGNGGLLLALILLLVFLHPLRAPRVPTAARLTETGVELDFGERLQKTWYAEISSYSLAQFRVGETDIRLLSFHRKDGGLLSIEIAAAISDESVHSALQGKVVQTNAA